MFGIVLSCAVTLMQVYVFWRAASVPLLIRRFSRKRIFIVGFALWAIFLLSRLFDSGDLGSTGKVLELFGMTWMATLFLTSVVVLSVDVVTGFGAFWPRVVPRLRGAAFIVGGVLTAVALVQGLRAPIVKDYPAYIEGLLTALDGTVIVSLSDLHLGTVLGEEWLAERVDQVQAEHPDLIVLTGDVFEGHSAPRPELLAGLRRLSAPLGVWGVLGNHESYIARSNNTALFEEAGVRLLRNAWIEPRPGLVLAGVDDLSFSRDPRQMESYISKALAARPTSATILLSHAPVATDFAVASGVKLMLFGHTHGGQIWPFSYLVEQRFPQIASEYAVGAMTLIVSRGTGTWGPRMRLWYPTEILRVTLHAGPNGA